MTEIEALQNAANKVRLDIYEKWNQDKRKTVKQYFAQRRSETVSPTLDYEQMNHFLLGWIRATEQINKQQ